MTIPIPLTDTLIEGTTGYYDFTLDLDVGALLSLTLTLYDVERLAIINGRETQDVLNTNGGTVTTDPGPPLVTTVHMELAPEDTVILNEGRLVEYRVLSFHWTWGSGPKHGHHAVQFALENVAHVP